MEDKLNYLKKYHRDVEIVQDGIADIEHIPNSWKHNFTLRRGSHVACDYEFS